MHKKKFEQPSVSRESEIVEIPKEEVKLVSKEVKKEIKNEPKEESKLEAMQKNIGKIAVSLKDNKK